MYLTTYIFFDINISTNQSGAAEAWWAHNPQVPGSKPGSDIREQGFSSHSIIIFAVFREN
mgnify:CR=1 FL=1